MKIVHVYPTDIYSQSRLFKEARFVLDAGLAESVCAIGLWVGDREVREQHSSGIDIIRVKTKLRQLFAERHIFSNIFYRKLLAFYSYIQYYSYCFRYIDKIRPDLLTCHYVSDLPMVCIMGWIRKCTVVYLPHELETERSGLKGIQKYRDRVIEHLFIRFPRDVVVVCDPIAQWYRAKYRIDNVHVVRNAPTQESARIKDKSFDFRVKFSIPQSSVIFIYQGMFGRGRGTVELIESFSRLESKGAHLVMMGFGSAEIESVVKDAALNNINIHYQEPVPLDLITTYSSGADIGIFVSEENSLSYELSLPNKFFEYVHAGLPVLVSNNLKYLSSLIVQNSLGVVVRLEDLVSSISSITPSEVDSYKKNIRQYAQSAFWENDAVAFSRVYRKSLE